MISEFCTTVAPYIPQRLMFLCNDSPLAITALSVLALSLTLYFITRVKDYLVLFGSAVLYLVPFVIRGY